VILYANSCTVTVVPIAVPKMTLVAWESVIRPAEAKPTSITVVALELWVTKVVTIPANSAVTLLRVIAAMVSRVFAPPRSFSAFSLRPMP